MRRPRATEESRARAARIAQALAGLLPDEPLVASERSPGARPAPGPAPVLRVGDCPACGASLHASAAAHGVEIDVCEACCGIWLDAGELELLTADVAPPPAAVRDEAALRRSVPAPRPEDEVRYRECPRCREVMLRRNFGTISGVIVDECPQHGLFLDAGELQAVEAFLRAGGRALGEAAKARAQARMMPPAPEPLPTSRHGEARSRGSALWDLLFRR